MFSMAMDEFNNVMGPETIQTIFRLIGERQAKEICKRLKDKYKEDWTLEKLGDVIVNNVINPAVGVGKSEFKINDGKMTITIKACPFKSAGIKISNQFYCQYTEGLIFSIAEILLGKINLDMIKLRAIDNCDCCFLLKV